VWSIANHVRGSFVRLDYGRGCKLRHDACDACTDERCRHVTNARTNGGADDGSDDAVYVSSCEA